ncbi:MAG: peptidylprolyl isomerase [Rhodospirillales bacterium]
MDAPHPAAAQMRWITDPMEDLRKKNPIVRVTVYLLFFLLILSFGLWGIGDYITADHRQDDIATVDGTPIPLVDFENRLRLEARQIQQRSGQPLSSEMLVATGVAQRSLRLLVERGLLDRLASDLGLAVAPQQVVQRIAQQQQFQDARGQFDQQRYLGALQSAGIRPEQYEAEVRADLERQYILASIIYGAKMPNAGSERIFDWREEARTISYITLPSAASESLPAPDKATLEALYEERKDSFRAPEYRSATLLHITPDSFLDAVDITPEELAEAVAAQAETFGTPELRAWRQSIFPNEAAAAAAMAAAEAGSTLAEAASAQGGSAPADLPLQPKSRIEGLLPQLADAVFADSATGDLVLAETPLGWHVIEIGEVVPREAAAEEQVEAAVSEDLKMEKAVTAMVSFVNEVDSELATGATLDETAGKLGLNLREIAAVDARGLDRQGQLVGDLPAPRDFLQLIFESDPDVDSLLQEANDGSFYAFRVDGITPAADRPFAEVEGRVEAAWRAAEAERLVLAEAEALAARIDSGEATLSEVAQGLGQPVIGAPPLKRSETPAQLRAMPDLVRAVFRAETGKAIVAPVANGAALAVVTAIEAASPAADEEGYTTLQSALDRDMREDLLSAFVASLETVYPVTYNGEALDYALSQF